MTKKASTAKKKAPAAKAPKGALEPEAPATPAVVFKALKCWSDCTGRVVKIKHPALGDLLHEAKVLNVNLTEGTILVALAGENKGRYLLPLDSTIAKVK